MPALSDISHGRNYPENLRRPLPFTVTSEYVAIPLRYPAIFPFAPAKLPPPFRNFRSFRRSGSIFLLTDLLISSASPRLVSCLGIATRRLYVYSSFIPDGFTLLVVLPKNKIRSIINSFKLSNTELPRLLIFLYCSAELFAAGSKHCCFYFVQPETLFL